MFTSRADLERRLDELGDRLARRGVHATIGVVGGAAMLLAYPSERAATHDVDTARIDPHGVVLDVVREMAVELGLPTTWLNDQAAMYAPRQPEWTALHSYDHPHLRVMVLAPRQMLAMKVLSGRPRDVDDIVTLLDATGIADMEAALAAVAAVFPGDEVGPRQRDVLTEALLRLPTD